MLKEQFGEQVAYQTDENMEISSFLSEEAMNLFLESGEIPDIACMDITEPKSISLCEKLRILYPTSFLVLIATMKISPVTYLKPTIMASALLLRPLETERVRDMAKTLIHMLDRAENDTDEVLIVRTKDGKNRIPYASILYIESREKKIYICTAAREYGFYGTIEQLEAELPQGFLRCHRSYIVNKSCVENVQISKGSLILTGDIYIPVSRKYKAVLKEYLS